MPDTHCLIDSLVFCSVMIQCSQSPGVYVREYSHSSWDTGWRIKGD
uniref:Uncharacterized protein n=1 Tax=Anguilla anguilla TaxID=7936 RepID=A0A0E9UW96_ANGAN